MLFKRRLMFIKTEISYLQIGPAFNKRQIDATGKLCMLKHLSTKCAVFGHSHLSSFYRYPIQCQFKLEMFSEKN